MAAASPNMPLLHNQSGLPKRDWQLDGVVRFQHPTHFARIGCSKERTAHTRHTQVWCAVNLYQRELLFSTDCPSREPEPNWRPDRLPVGIEQLLFDWTRRGYRVFSGVREFSLIAR